MWQENGPEKDLFRKCQIVFIFGENYKPFKVKILFSFQISPTVENPNAYSKIKDVLIQNGFLWRINEN